MSEGGVSKMLNEFLKDNSEKNQVKKQLYRLILQTGPVSKVELLKTYRVPHTTLTRMIHELEGKQLVGIFGFGESSGGRPPVLYDVVPSAGFLIGIEIAHTHVQILLTDIKFNVIAQSKFLLTPIHTPEVTMKTMIECIHHLLKEHFVQTESLLGIGVGSVGPLDRENGLILNPEALPAQGWEQVQITSKLKEEFNIPIVLNNGANTAALAEFHFRNFQEENILYCINGYGLRCGYISKGQLLNMKEGDASSFGHIIIETNGRPCICGKNGCLTSYASYGAILNRIREKQDTKNKEYENIDDLIQGFENRNPLVHDAIMESAFYFGVGLANMINTMHPDVIILHGKLVYQCEEYFEEVVQTAIHYKYNRAGTTEIKKGSLGENATAIGAAIQVLYQLL